MVTTHWLKKRWRWLVATGVVIGGALAFWFGLAEPIHAHSVWYKRVRVDHMTLVDRRPPGVTKGQWDYAVGWTINLHANCGEANREWREQFAVELERRLEGQITLVDIEWIWDEYARNTKYGQRYSDNYRPTKDPMFGNLESVTFGLGVK
jgi:hypothetical protein